jgi:branched-subunit amino acid transport protein
LPWQIWVIAAAGAGTYLMRALPLVGRWTAWQTWPTWLGAVVDHVTPAVLGALLLPGLLLPDGRLPAHLLADPALWALVPTLAAALWSRNLLATVAVGVSAYAAVQALTR